jgi:cell division septum initiation protein DivIVA
VSDTHQDEVVDVHEDDYERERREARERAYQDVSLRAVELLANAQRAADEAVAEAQSYARDLEETARDQYRVILQRANEAARATAGAQPEPDPDPDPDPEPDAVGGQDAGLPRAAVTAPPSAAEAQQLEYVRTYARVAHSQLRAVLGALNDELDKLADLAQPDGGPASGAPIEVSEPPPEPSAAEVDEPGESPEPGADTGLDGHAVHPHDGHHQG